MMRRFTLALAALWTAVAPIAAEAQQIVNRPRVMQAVRPGLALVQTSSEEPALFTAINANGWSAPWATGTPPTLTPDSAPLAQARTRQGFNGSCEAVTFSEPVIPTARIRQPYPNQATPTNDVALDDFVYSTDTLAGVENNSTKISPPPIVQWALPDHRVVGNTLTVDLVAFHRDGRASKPVACISGTATDGSTTVTALTASVIELGHAGDRNPVYGYRLTFDTTPLADNAIITANAKAYPWVGGATSVADSSTGTPDTRGFVPQIFLKNVSKAASPPYGCVNASTGVNATVDANGAASGVTKISTSAATACANPFQTTASAMQAMVAATAVTGGVTSGGVIRIQGAVTLATSSAITYQNVGELIVEGDPGDATAAIITGASNVNTRQPFLRYRNIAINRTGGTSSMGSGSTKVVLENVAVDNDNKTGALFNVPFSFLGVTIANAGGTSIANSGSSAYLTRGVQSSASFAIEAFLVLGSAIDANTTLSSFSARPPHGGIVAFNRFMKVTGGALDLGTSFSVNGFALVQNVFEWISTTSASAIGLSRDSGSGNLTHMVVAYNTFIGAESFGRNNIFYDESAGVYRTHELNRALGNIWNQINNKSDLFANDGAHVGNWSIYYGAGWLANWSMFIDAAGAGPTGSFAQAYPGRKANIGTSATVRNDPQFVDYKGTTLSGSTPVAGAGGGDYNLQSGSGAIGLIPVNDNEMLPRDLAGNLRDRRSAGAYR